MGNRLFYKALWVVLKPIYAVVFPCRVHGVENLPKEGGFVLCANHISGNDPLILATKLPINRSMTFLGKKEVFEWPFVGMLMKLAGGIPVDRGNADISAIRNSLAALKEGKGLLIFPQGTRCRNNERAPMLNGASMIALRGGVPVHPAYIDGPYKAFRRVDVYFGKAIDLSAYGKRCDNETLSSVTRQIEASVWGLKEEDEK